MRRPDERAHCIACSACDLCSRDARIVFLEWQNIICCWSVSAIFIHLKFDCLRSWSRNNSATWQFDWRKHTGHHSRGGPGHRFPWMKFSRAKNYKSQNAAAPMQATKWLKLGPFTDGGVEVVAWVLIQFCPTTWHGKWKNWNALPVQNMWRVAMWPIDNRDGCTQLVWRYPRVEQ